MMEIYPFGIEHIFDTLSDCTFRLSMPRSDPHRDDPHRSYMEGRSHACFWCTLVWAHTGEVVENAPPCGETKCSERPDRIDMPGQRETTEQVFSPHKINVL